MSAPTPPGWPAAVRPAGAPDWERTAGEWLIDLCPPDFRGYPVLRRQPLALAWLAGQHVAGAQQAMARGLSRLRADLAATLPPPAVEELIAAVEQEQARLRAAARGVELVEQALRGHRYIPRL